MIYVLSDTHNRVQKKAIKKFGDKFSLDKFYNIISKDFTAITEYNEILNEFNIHIDYFPRIQDSKGNWYIDTIYLPVMVKENI